MPKTASFGFKMKLQELLKKWYERFLIAVTCAGVSAMILSCIYPHGGLIGEGLLGGFTVYVDILLDKKAGLSRPKAPKILDQQSNARKML